VNAPSPGDIALACVPAWVVTALLVLYAVSLTRHSHHEPRQRRHRERRDPYTLSGRQQRRRRYQVGWAEDDGEPALGEVDEAIRRILEEAGNGR
jgi:hypothetical protein